MRTFGGPPCRVERVYMGPNLVQTWSRSGPHGFRPSSGQVQGSSDWIQTWSTADQTWLCWSFDRIQIRFLGGQIRPSKNLVHIFSYGELMLKKKTKKKQILVWATFGTHGSYVCQTWVLAGVVSDISEYSSTSFSIINALQNLQTCHTYNT